MHKNAQKTTFQSTATAAQKRPLWGTAGRPLWLSWSQTEKEPQKTVYHCPLLAVSC